MAIGLKNAHISPVACEECARLALQAKECHDWDRTCWLQALRHCAWFGVLGRIVHAKLIVLPMPTKSGAFHIPQMRAPVVVALRAATTFSSPPSCAFGNRRWVDVHCHCTLIACCLWSKTSSWRAPVHIDLPMITPLFTSTMCASRHRSVIIRCIFHESMDALSCYCICQQNVWDFFACHNLALHFLHSLVDVAIAFLSCRVCIQFFPQVCSHPPPTGACCVTI